MQNGMNCFGFDGVWVGIMCMHVGQAILLRRGYYLAGMTAGTACIQHVL